MVWLDCLKSFDSPRRKCVAKAAESFDRQQLGVIAAGAQVRISIRNQYNTYGFSGKKYVVLSENSWVGGKNNFLGIVFIVLGALAFLIAISFFVA